jgi:hypothetical protein
MSCTVHCSKCNQEREFPPKTSFIYYIITAELVGDMLKPLFRRCEVCKSRFAYALAAANRQGGSE